MNRHYELNKAITLLRKSGINFHEELHDIMNSSIMAIVEGVIQDVLDGKTEITRYMVVQIDDSQAIKITLKTGAKELQMEMIQMPIKIA